MDEGFTTYISTLAKDHVLKENKDFPLEGSYRGYINLATSGVEMPQATNANRYAHNYAYESTAYNKGAVFLSQLGYVIGKEKLEETCKPTTTRGNLNILYPTIFESLLSGYRGFNFNGT